MSPEPEIQRCRTSKKERVLSKRNLTWTFAAAVILLVVSAAIIWQVRTASIPIGRRLAEAWVKSDDSWSETLSLPSVVPSELDMARLYASPVSYGDVGYPVGSATVFAPSPKTVVKVSPDLVDPSRIGTMSLKAESEFFIIVFPTTPPDDWIKDFDIFFSSKTWPPIADLLGDDQKATALRTEVEAKFGSMAIKGIWLRMLGATGRELRDERDPAAALELVHLLYHRQVLELTGSAYSLSRPDGMTAIMVHRGYGDYGVTVFDEDGGRLLDAFCRIPPGSKWQNKQGFLISNMLGWTPRKTIPANRGSRGGTDTLIAPGRPSTPTSAPGRSFR